MQKLSGGTHNQSLKEVSKAKKEGDETAIKRVDKKVEAEDTDWVDLNGDPEGWVFVAHGDGGPAQ